MKIFLCGQKYFGQDVLKLLLHLGHDVVGVSAPPAGGRGRPDRLWRLADQRGLPLLEAGRLNAGTLPHEVDLIVAAHSHDVIGRATRLKARLGAIGYHPSLLPLHRGRDAIRWTVKMGDRIAGGTVYWLTDAIDGGPIAAQDWCFVRPGSDPEALWRRDLQPMGLRLFKRVLGDLGAGRLVRIPQDRKAATWEPSWERPPVFRPDLPQIGPPPEGFKVLTRRHEAVDLGERKEIYHQDHD